jgi:hypothetical protein
VNSSPSRNESSQPDLRKCIEDAADTFRDASKALRLLRHPVIAEGMDIAERACREVLAASAPSETGPSKTELLECLQFWRHYSSLNEGAQDDIADEKGAWLDKMEDWWT